MNDISPEDAELIVEAASAGSTVPGHEALGEALTDLHAPHGLGEMAGAAPSVAGAGSPGVVARMTRRTAVAASVAVLSVAGVAAAATGDGELLDPVFGLGEPVIVEMADDDDAGEEAEAEEPADDEGEVPADDEGEVPADDEGEDEAADDGEHGNNRDELLELIDPSDGIDEDELETICDEADNHGSYVSTVARDKVDEEKGGHGARVSEAAQSGCGKVDAGDDEGDDEADNDEADEADDDEGDDEADDEADDDDGRNNGNGNGNGNDRGNGKGNDNGRGNGNGNGRGHDNGDDD